MPRPRPRRKRRLSRRGRVVLIVLAVFLLVLILSLRAIAQFYTDYLWFESLDLSGVWSGVLGSKLSLAVIFTVVFFIALWLNLYVADRVAPRFRTPGPEDELLERYHEVVAPRQGLIRGAVALIFALIAGVGVSSQWNDWVLFRNRIDFGIEDPQFGLDVGFYVFQLPFYTFVVNWAFASLIIIIIVTSIAHYLNGGIRMQVSGERVTSQVKVHLSVLLAVLALVKAADYWLQRYELTVSQRGTVDGALYTDVNAQLPAINLLLLISLFAAGLFIINIWRKGWVFPVLAVGLWALVALVVGTGYPAFVQRFQVEPDESAKEDPYIARNIEATRAAMGIDLSDEQVVDFDYETSLPDDAITENEATIRNIRLLDPAVVNDTYQRLEGEKGWFIFRDLDVDRYQIDGDETQVVLSARELNEGGIPQQSWEGQHLAFTHGYGLALSPANAVTANGRPDFRVGGLPVESTVTDIEVDQPQLYVGEDLEGYSIVNTSRAEEDGTGEVPPYEGDGGVPIGGFLKKAAFALRFGEIDPLISGFLDDDSRIIFNRDVRERVETVAPFFQYDSDPYPVVTDDGRMVYILDGYATTDRYPYAQQADTGSLPSGSALDGIRFNYMRNSVKAVIDAYDGSVTLYLTDKLYDGEEDPIARAYAQAFPELFVDTDEIPEDLKAHFRYPEDMFRVQTNMYNRYHMTDAAQFYGNDDLWDIAQDPGTAITGDQGGEGDSSITGEKKMDPYYLLMRLPEAEQEEFLLLRSFVPVQGDGSPRNQLVSFMVGKSDPQNFGELQVYEMTVPGTDGERNSNVDGPAIVQSNILSTTEIAEQITLLDQQGSSVLWGNMLIIPVSESLLYVRPLYVQAKQDAAVPELRKVVVALGQSIVMADTLEEAILEVFPEAQITTQEEEAAGDTEGEGEGTEGEGEGTEGEGEPETTATVGSLLADAVAAFTAADEALADGDLGTYQEQVELAAQLVTQAIELLATQEEPSGDSGGGGPGDTTTTTEATGEA
ncbi:MAG: hypothetical protein JJLCMIEE_02736 [Acidimicrobiales bacterium]|nr:hypothetical protein [Acidimicrobiales bacterium]